MRALLALACCVAASACTLGSAPPPPRVNVAELIEQLGARTFEQREGASARLRALPEALPRLRQAAKKHPDAEVRRRAARAARHIAGRGPREAWSRAAALVKTGDLDQAVELNVKWRKYDSHGLSVAALTEGLKRVATASSALIKDRDARLNAPLTLTAEELLTQLKTSSDNSKQTLVTQSDKATGGLSNKLIRVSEVRSVGIHISIVVTSGAVSAGQMHLSPAVVNGRFDAGAMNRSILVCDGSVTIGRYCSNCIIIARGAVSIDGDVDQCVIYSGASINVKDRRTVTGSVLKPNAVSFPGGVRFFDLGRAGLNVSGLKVKAARKGSCFAGKVRPGDTVTAVDGARVANAEALRKRLRPHFAAGTPFTLTLTRGGKEIRVAITPDR